jgi:RNA polymerase sigma factor (sigma-70 family)
VERASVQRPPAHKKDWVLNQEAFDALLVSLDHNREHAGTKYEQIRHALITFFECRGSGTPEEHADDTITRVARRLLEGQTIRVDKPASYFYGVARNVLKEYWESRGRGPISLESQSAATLGSPDPHRLQEQISERQLKEQRLDCLERCLDQLSPNDRAIIRTYYTGDTGIKIQTRRRLAESLGIPINALRIRALRIREKLEDCVETCLSTAVHD